MTAHRAENVDDEARFRDLLVGVELAAEAHDAEVIYPVHPRAQDRIETFDIEIPTTSGRSNRWSTSTSSG